MVAGAGVLALAVTACGPGSSETAGSDRGTDKPAAATALPVESTVRKATWTDRNTTHQLTLAPTRLARGTAADLDQVGSSTHDLKGMVPYYLTVTYTNTGPEALSGPDPENNFTVTLADGTPGRVFSLWNRNPLATESGFPLPDDCHEAGPAAVQSGAEATVCALVVLPEGHTPATVAYSDEADRTLLWKVGDGKGDDNGKTLLPPGTAADSAYRGISAEAPAVPIRVTPKSVRAGSLKDLADFDLSPAQKDSVPWYVTFEYRNLGEEKLLPTMDDGVGLRTAGGREVRPMSLIDFSGAAEGPGIDQCRGGAPHTRLEPDSALTLCSVHLLPRGDRPAMVSFQSEDAKSLMWRAT